MSGHGREFFDLVKAIGESKSKQEEDRIVADEVVFLKKKIVESGIPKKKVKELLVRAIYVEMLGQDASYAYIRAVELCASTNIAQKRTGYLFAALCFAPTHEFRFMLVNQLQRDMSSSNHLEVCAALVALTKLVTYDMIPALQGDIIKQLKHDNDIVRKRAVCALHRCFQLDKTCLMEHAEKIRRVLCDKDPSVMGASLPLLYDMIVEDPITHKDLVSSFVSILKQITEHRLPREFDYHRIPAPWIQMHILRLLALLGRGDQASSEQMYEVIVDVMRRADTGINVGYAIVYEVVKTITTIYPNPLLLDAAATSISRFIRSDSHNLKYIGIKGLAAIVKDHPRYAADHQMAVIDCLEDPDETLKRKTLDLLFRMTNAANVEFIVNKLLFFLERSSDEHFKSDLVTRITQCAETFAPSNGWYVKTMIKIFELAGDRVKSTVTETLMQLVAEGSDNQEGGEGGEEDEEEDLRVDAVEDFLELVEKAKLPPLLSQTVAWVLGEYGYLSVSHDPVSIMNKLVALSRDSKDNTTKGCIVTALLKLVAQAGGECPPTVSELINELCNSISIDVQQRALEFKALVQFPELLVNTLPMDASLEDIEVDDQLSFMNDFVQSALAGGAIPYSPPATYDDDEDAATPTASGLKVTPYAMPSMPAAGSVAIGTGGRPSSNTPGAAGGGGIKLGGSSSANSAANVEEVTSTTGAVLTNTSAAVVGLKFASGNNSVWGKKPPTPPPAPPVPVTVIQPGEAPPPDAGAGGDLFAGMSTTDSSSTGATGASPVPASPAAAPAAAPSPVAAQPAAPPEPPKPKVLSEKEKMAAMLFSGVGPSGGSGGSSKGRRASQRTSGASPHPPLPPQASASPVAASALAPASNASHDMLDLLGDSNYAPAATPSPAHAQAAGASASASASAAGMDDMFAGMSTASPSANSAPAPPLPPAAAAPVAAASPSAANKPATNLVDIFGDLSTGSDSGSTPTSASGVGGIMSQFGTSSSPVPGGPVMSAIVKPFRLTTAEFGGKWGQLGSEMKSTLPCAAHIRSLELLRSTMTANTMQGATSPNSGGPVDIFGGGDAAGGDVVNAYHHVESIPTTNEAIFAAHSGTGLTEPVLVHIKIVPARNTCHIIVKSSSRGVGEMVMSELSSANGRSGNGNKNGRLVSM